METMGNNKTLVCPVCRKKHRAQNKEKSFPQNIYLLVHIQRRAYERCQRHNMELTLYCYEDICRKPICLSCIVDHNKHDVKTIETKEMDLLKKESQNIKKSLKAKIQIICEAKKYVAQKTDACVTQLRPVHTMRFFSDCDCDSFYRNKWVAQHSMEVFTLCDCDNVTNPYVAHCKQKTNRSHNQKKSHSVNEPLEKTKDKLVKYFDELIKKANNQRNRADLHVDKMKKAIDLLNQMEEKMEAVDCETTTNFRETVRRILEQNKKDFSGVRLFQFPVYDAGEDIDRGEDECQYRHYTMTIGKMTSAEFLAALPDMGADGGDAQNQLLPGGLNAFQLKCAGTFYLILYQQHKYTF